jgi:hypothetical protein
MVTADDRLYVADGNNLKYSTNLSSFSTVTGTPAYSIISIVSDGYNVYASFSNSTVYYSAASGSSASSHATGHEFGKIEYVKGRLMVAGTGSDKNKIWNLTNAAGSPTNNPTALFTHPNTNFTWIGFAAGQDYIYAGGYSGNKTLIYKTQIKPDGTSLDTPTVAGELPLGEVITGMRGYLGNVLIGLEDGFRFCTTDDAGNLIIGPKVVIGSPVETFSGIGQYVYFGWKNFDASSTGIGRMDISVFISPNQPAYASDLMATGQGTIVDIHEFDGSPIFSVAGLGIYKAHATDLVSSGYLRSGIYRWGIPDAKFIPKLDIRCLPLVGSVTISVASDDGAFYDFPTISTPSIKEYTIDGLQSKVYESEIKVTLNRASGGTTGPTLTRWMARAYAAPLRSQIFTVPILMHHHLQINDRDYWQNVDTELAYLRDLVDNPRVVVYQENTETFPVVVEQVQMQIMQMTQAQVKNDFEGTAIVVMRSVR